MRCTGVVLVVLGASTSCRDPDPGGSDSSGVTSTTTASTLTTTASSSGPSESSDTSPPTGVGQPLVTPEGWVPAGADGDPFAAERPDPIECALGFGVETGAFEVDTELCLYAAFVQPTLAPIDQGDTIELVMLHDALYAVDPAVAHVAIAFGDELAWETELPIPSEPALLRPRWTATAAVPAGTPAHFHLHNHGINNYRLVALTIAPP